MRLTALMPVRNEAWCLGLTARVALMWCDELIVLLHACTDDSAAIIEQVQNEHKGRVHILVDPDPKWDEMRHRQELLMGARAFGATHIALVDADETVSGYHAAREMVPKLDAGSILQFPLYNTRGSRTIYHANGTWGNRWVSVAFVDDIRLRWNGDTFHRREPQGLHLQPWKPIPQGAGGVIHLWGASYPRLRAKHALYKMVERIRWPQKPLAQIDAYYNQAMSSCDGSAWRFSETPAEWWAPYEHLLKYLDMDADPWQEQECRKLRDQHGAQIFHGLDLFGVV